MTCFSRLIAGLAACCVAALLLQRRAELPGQDNIAFVSQGSPKGFLTRPLQSRLPGPIGGAAQDETGSGSTLTASIATAFLAAALLGRGRSRVAMYGHWDQKKNRLHWGGARGWRPETILRETDKMFTAEKETRDPTSIPMWQRDTFTGYHKLRRTLVKARKQGRRVYHDVRVIEQMPKGCMVELLSTGFVGYIPIHQEGNLGTGVLKSDDPRRLKVGDVVKAECTAFPFTRVIKMPTDSHYIRVHSWVKHEAGKVMPIFSHKSYLINQAQREKGAELEVGSIIEVTVNRHLPRGMIMNLNPEDPDSLASGMLEYNDVSRSPRSIVRAKKMFPEGTRLKVYVVQVQGGRVTLSTKEFEDDNHVGWMWDFPEYCQKNAESALEKYNQKKQAYIMWLQREDDKIPDHFYDLYRQPIQYTGA